MLRIAGVNILYNPGNNVVSNIFDYINQLEQLYIVDNSEEEKKEITNQLKSLPQIKFLDNKGNIGIAAALNKAAKQAINDGYDLLLTMDQDSKLSENYISGMLKEFDKDERIGILSPFVIHTANPKKPSNTGLEEVTVAMTSGSIINLSAFKKIGGYLEKLFIDYVDNEYCLRMISNGYKVMQLNSVYINHNLGDVKKKRFIFKNVFPTNHAPIRWYYRTRNRFYIYKTYKETFGEYIRQDKILFIKELLKIFLYENEKLKKIKSIYQGYIDFKKGKFDKVN